MCLAPTFKNNFQNTKNKNNCLWDHFYFWDLKKYIYLHKVICRLLFFFVDNDKRIELIINLKCESSFCDKYKLHNLRDKRVWTSMWGPLFSIYLQLCY